MLERWRLLCEQSKGVLDFPWYIAAKRLPPVWSRTGIELTAMPNRRQAGDRIEPGSKLDGVRCESRSFTLRFGQNNGHIPDRVARPLGRPETPDLSSRPEIGTGSPVDRHRISSIGHARARDMRPNLLAHCTTAQGACDLWLIKITEYGHDLRTSYGQSESRWQTPPELPKEGCGRIRRHGAHSGP